MNETPTPPPSDEPGDAPESPTDPTPAAAGGAEPPDQAESPDATPPQAACTECGGPLEEDQTYCLVCGEPTPKAPALRRQRGPGWLVGALVVLGLGAGALAFVLASDDEGSAAGSVSTLVTVGVTTVPSTLDTSGLTTGSLPTDTTGSISTPTEGTQSVDTGFVTTTSGTAGTLPTDTTGSLPTDTTGSFPTDTTGSLPTDTTGSFPTTTAATTTDVVPTATDEEIISDWPVGTSAWTTIVASATDATAARAAQDRAVSSGFGAKILLSDDHPDLTPGLYVVYVGVFRNKADAVAMTGRAQSSFPGAYPRYISS